MKLALILLLAPTLALGQWKHVPEKGERTQPTGQQSTIHGCVIGSEPNFALTDTGTGQVFLLHGNQPSLKDHVGHEVVLTGNASYANYHTPTDRPETVATAGRQGRQDFDVVNIVDVASSCQSGSAVNAQQAVATSQAALGSVSNNPAGTEPQVGYAGENMQSGTSLEGCLSRGGSDNFVLSEPAWDRHYPVQGNNAALSQNVGRWVRLQGVLKPQPGNPSAAPTFEASGVQMLRASCTEQSAPGESPMSAGGKTGNRGDAIPESSTATAGTPTPAWQSDAGRAQQPGKHTIPDSTAPQNQAKYGAPPNWEQVGQGRQTADNHSAKVEQTEVGSSYGTLGVQGNRPAYDNTQQGKYPNGENTGLRKMPANEAKYNRAPNEGEQTVSGCLKKSGDRYLLHELNNGGTLRLAATADQLDPHVNHLVEISGGHTPRGTQGQIGAKESADEFRVHGIRDLAATCGASSGSGVH